MSELGRSKRYPSGPPPRCMLAVQAIQAGPQDTRVSVVAPSGSTTGFGYVSVRVGRVLLVIEDQDALNSWKEALQEAEQVGRKHLTPPQFTWQDTG